VPVAVIVEDDGGYSEPRSSSSRPALTPATSATGAPSPGTCAERASTAVSRCRSSRSRRSRQAVPLGPFACGSGRAVGCQRRHRIASAAVRRCPDASGRHESVEHLVSDDSRRRANAPVPAYWGTRSVPFWDAQSGPRYAVSSTSSCWAGLRGLAVRHLQGLRECRGNRRGRPDISALPLRTRGPRSSVGHPML
jgi:hypothetical protein